MEKALERFFSEMRGRLKTAESTRAIIARESSPDFNLLHALGIGEIHLSRLLARLLDPKAEHGQGPLFLRGFLELCRAPGDARDGRAVLPDLEPLERVTVRLEHETDRRRRIDILLRSGDGRSAVGIENKPWAGDQDDQLADYRRYLEGAFPGHWMLVYLVGDPERPVPVEDERIRKVTYGELGKCLEAMLGRIRSPIAATSTRQVLDYIEREFEGGWSLEAMTDAQQIIEAVTADPQHVEVAWRLIAAREDLREQIALEFHKRIADAIGQDFIVSRDDKRRPGERRFGFNVYKANPSWCTNMFVRLEWEVGSYRDCFLGIPTDKTIANERRDHQGGYWEDVGHAVKYFEWSVGEIGEKKQGEITNDDNWIIWRWAISPYRNWDWNNPAPWKELVAARTTESGSEIAVVAWFAGAIRNFWAAIDAYFEERDSRSS